MLRCLPCSGCEVEGECLAVGPGLHHITSVTSAEACAELCWERRDTCNYFTFYNQSASSGEN